MKCRKHDCKMVKETKPGWGGQEILVCPECALEKVQMAIRNQAVTPEVSDKPSRRGGWR